MSYFTTSETFFVIPLNTSDEEIQKIEFLLEILEKSNIGELIKQSYLKTSDLGRKSYNPYKLFAAIVYCFSMHKGSLRNMEEMIKYDLRLNYILGQKSPSYKTISEFINKVIKPNQYELFSSITNTIINELRIDISDQYLDGTKIEANANKYKFVFKKRKHWVNLDSKIQKLLLDLNVGFKKKKTYVDSKEFKKYLDIFSTRENIQLEDIPKGKGKRPTRNQKLYQYGYQLLSRLISYEEIEEICGPNRNSYYKTDKDATAMALKCDYYSGHGSNMKAAYNVQFLVSAGLVMMYGVFQDRTDYYTFEPMLNLYNEHYNSYPLNICADSGYGVYDNYKYLNDHSINNYIKYLNWSGETSGKKPQMFFLNENEDGFICMNGNTGTVISFEQKHQRKKNSKLYKFEGCLSCPYEYKCRNKIKDRTTNYREFELSITEEKYHVQVRNNLLSPKGIEIRVNRSIQAEGTFGELKQNLGYTRIRRRGLKQVSCEIMLMSLAINIRKLFTIYDKDDVESKYWKVDENTIIEPMPQVKPKKKSC